MAEPNPKQTLILWALLAQGGTAAQKGFRPEIQAKDREALRKAGLLTWSKGKRGAIQLEVTDAGWNWAGGHLDAPLPARAITGTAQVLQAWLGRLQAYMRANDVPLADILTASPQIQREPGRTPEPEPSPKAQLSPEALRERVRRVYLEATGGRFNDTVPLSRIRAKLADVDRSAVDETLLRMHSEPGTTLMNLENPREIEAERSAGVSVGGVDMHVLWISR